MHTLYVVNTHVNEYFINSHTRVGTSAVRSADCGPYRVP